MSRLLRGGTRTAGAVMAAGSASFLAGAFMPVSRVHVEREPQRKLEILLANPEQRRAQTMLLGAGASMLPAGVAVLAREWDRGRAGGEQERLAGRRLAQAGAVLLAAGAAVFPVDLAARFTDPEGFALGQQPEWPFQGYVWVSLAGMAALGAALLQRSRTHGGFPRWPGWLNLGGAATFAAVLAGTGDLPPLTIYCIESATGAALVLRMPGTPPYPLSRAERLQTSLLVFLYRILGPLMLHRPDLRPVLPRPRSENRNRGAAA